MSISPYIARDRRFGDMTFDFWICDETGRSWYDSSPNQHMMERDWCRRHLQPGFTAIDCGAHHGLMSVLFGKWVGPTGRVIAYEALRTNAEVVRKNAELNHLDNVTVRPVGVGQDNMIAAISVNKGNTVVVGGCKGSDRIEIVSLDKDLSPDIRVDFLKIDVEGFEGEALRGARRILQQRPIVVLELHNFMFSDRVSVLARVLSELSSAYWTFEVQGEILDVDFRRFDGPIDLHWLAAFDNPHVFCVPRETARLSHLWFDWKNPLAYRAALRIGRLVGLIDSERPPVPSPRDTASLEQRLMLLHVGALGAMPDDPVLAQMRDDVIRRPEAETEAAALVRVTAPLIARAFPGADRVHAASLIRQFYANLFRREPDAEGFAYWTQELGDALAASRAGTERSAASAAAEVLLAIISGADSEDRARLAALASPSSSWTTPGPP